MPRRIEKRDHPAIGFYVIGADVLGNATGLASGDAGAPDVVQQRGLAVVDVAHDRDDWRTRLQFATHLVLGRGQDLLFDIFLLLCDGGVAHFLNHEHRGLLIQHLVDRHHHAHLHQRLDHLRRLDRHALRQVAN